jgi:putative spermidine/putrescine transport system permease protein
VAVLLVLPVLVIVPLSFSASSNFQFPPPAWSTRWYESLFASPAWTFALDNSLKVGALTALLATTLGTLAALGMSKMPRRWSGLFSGFVMIPLIIPNILVALAVYSTFLNLKLNGTLTGLVLAHTAIALPFVVIAVRARLQGMDSRLTTAALSLGATPVAAFRQIIFPLLLPGVLSAVVLAFVTSFDEVVIALFLHTPGNTTLPVQMFNSVAIEIDPTISAAASLVVVVVSLAILIGQLALLRRRKGALR